MVTQEQPVDFAERIVNDSRANKYGRFMLLEAGVVLGLHAASKVSKVLGINVLANVTEAAATACTVPLAVDTIRFARAAAHAVARVGSVS